jgi:hypothetical protein
MSPDKIPDTTEALQDFLDSLEDKGCSKEDIVCALELNLMSWRESLEDD